MKAIVIVLVVATAAHAQAPTSNQVIAEQLFEEGRKLATANNWSAACPKFEESLKLDPTLGTRLNLATCYEHVGKVASAWSLYREAAEQSAQEPKRRDYALDHAKALEARLPSLQIVVPKDPPAGFVVKRDDVALDGSALGVSLYADPGSHTITASAPGFHEFTTTTTLSEGKSTTVTVPPLEPAPVAKTPDAVVEPVRATPITTEHWSTWSYTGIGVAAGGVAVVAVGLVFGAKANSAFSDEKSVCPNLACTGQAALASGQADARDSRHDAAIATGLAIGGAAAIVGGAALWLFGPRDEVVATPAISSNSVGVSLSGAF